MKELLFLKRVKQEVLANRCLSQKVKYYLLQLVKKEYKKLQASNKNNQDSTLNSKLPGC